ncbi:hypothetical protein QA601_03355 [Chitinispirillales bacterium ANBcel5]|uniref:hypothetical protein n=1 Tax=Cellulosispirillum alkaliphilum TaxID=3039283 RepID=UPI002A523867|nr:hypothetical protein [Chitinispirillales bacterium ANBcel5]
MSSHLFWILFLKNTGFSFLAALKYIFKKACFASEKTTLVGSEWDPVADFKARAASGVPQLWIDKINSFTELNWEDSSNLTNISTPNFDNTSVSITNQPQKCIKKSGLKIKHSSDRTALNEPGQIHTAALKKSNINVEKKRSFIVSSPKTLVYSLKLSKAVEKEVLSSKYISSNEKTWFHPIITTHARQSSKKLQVPILKKDLNKDKRAPLRSLKLTTCRDESTSISDKDCFMHDSIGNELKQCSESKIAQTGKNNIVFQKQSKQQHQMESPVFKSSKLQQNSLECSKSFLAARNNYDRPIVKGHKFLSFNDENTNKWPELMDFREVQSTIDSITVKLDQSSLEKLKLEQMGYKWNVLRLY